MVHCDTRPQTTLHPRGIRQVATKDEPDHSAPALGLHQPPVAQSEVQGAGSWTAKPDQSGHQHRTSAGAPSLPVLR